MRKLGYSCRYYQDRQYTASLWGLCLLHEQLPNRMQCVLSVVLNVMSTGNVTQMLLEIRDRNVLLLMP